jgi:membrane protein required for colicin V production
MTVFDFAVIGVIILSGYFAYSRGFVREALSIAAWINASFIALYTFPYVLPLFEKVLPKGVIANVCAAAVVFILALMVLHMISNALARRVKDSSLSPVDRTFGLIFGLARGLIFVCLGYIALAWMLPTGKDRPKWFADARSIPYLDAGAGKLRSFVPLPRTNTTTKTANAGSSAGSTAEKEAESAINAFRNPSSNAVPPANAAPVYTPDEQRGLNRLIQQQNSK